MVVKRNKPKPLPETPNQLTKQSKASRNSAYRSFHSYNNPFCSSTILTYIL
ncbi:hypothetical protein [Vibrio salilacus]|uniref:hypothetical protein n=1 Tax=Vibrio salilacus TaxID=1323749 RepID=UPI0012FD3F53|nr:hypothetical protein [Vibrio salilacus]